MYEIQIPEPHYPRIVNDTYKQVIALDEISTPEEYAALQGKVDAVMVGNMLLDAVDVGAALEDLTRQ